MVRHDVTGTVRQEQIVQYIQHIYPVEKNSGKSVYKCDVCMCWFMGVCASHADEMKNGGRLKHMCQQNANPDNKEGLHVPA